MSKTHDIVNKSDWYKHTEEEQAFYENKGCLEKRIKCSAGSMVFWDSRTIAVEQKLLEVDVKKTEECSLYLYGS